MKKWLLIISATVICVAAAFLYFFSLTPKGDTITSRESILNTAISKGNEWTIAKELELGGYIVSGAYSADNKSTLAIFEPTGNGDYKFSTSTNRNSDEIIVGGVAINGEWERGAEKKNRAGQTECEKNDRTCQTENEGNSRK